jgi:hypothetical protein
MPNSGRPRHDRSSFGLARHAGSNGRCSEVLQSQGLDKSIGAAPATDLRRSKKRSRRIADRLPIRDDGSFDHVIGADTDVPRDGEPEFPRCAQVEHQIELGTLLERDLAGRRALEDLIDQRGRALVERLKIALVRRDTAGIEVAPSTPDGGQTQRRPPSLISSSG